MVSRKKDTCSYSTLLTSNRMRLVTHIESKMMMLSLLSRFYRGYGPPHGDQGACEAIRDVS